MTTTIDEAALASFAAVPPLSGGASSDGPAFGSPPAEASTSSNDAGNKPSQSAAAANKAANDDDDANDDDNSSSSSSDDDSDRDENGLSAYERQRQANIERNQRELQALGLLDGGGLRGPKQQAGPRNWQKKTYTRIERVSRTTREPDRLSPYGKAVAPIGNSWPGHKGPSMREIRNGRDVRSYAQPPSSLRPGAVGSSSAAAASSSYDRFGEWGARMQAPALGTPLGDGPATAWGSPFIPPHLQQPQRCPDCKGSNVSMRREVVREGVSGRFQLKCMHEKCGHEWQVSQQQHTHTRTHACITHARLYPALITVLSPLSFCAYR